MTEAKTLGKMFKQIRNERNLTQDQVAFDIEQGSSGNSIISKAEKGIMTLDISIRLMNYYGIELKTKDKNIYNDVILDPKGNIEYVKLLIENYELNRKLEDK